MSVSDQLKAYKVVFYGGPDGQGGGVRATIQLGRTCCRFGSNGRRLGTDSSGSAGFW